MKILILKNKRAFTLIEILIVIALFSAIILIGVPFSQSTLAASELEAATEVTVKSLKLTQTQSQAVKEDATWGVRIVGHNIVQFKGDSYDLRDEAYDGLTQFSDKTLFLGLTEVVFSKIDGLPDQTGNIVIENSGKSRTITIYANGAINY